MQSPLAKELTQELVAVGALALRVHRGTLIPTFLLGVTAVPVANG